MANRIRLFESAQDGSVHFLVADKLWEIDTSDLEESVREKGFRVLSCRKVIHESRGVIRLELSDSVSSETVSSLLEMDVQTVDAPKSGFIYTAKEKLLVRALNGDSDPPVKVTKGTKMFYAGPTGTTQYVFQIQDGPHAGESVQISAAEWENVSDQLAETGPGDAAPEDLEDDDPEVKPKAKERSKDSSMSMLRVTRDFPDWPERENLKNYLSPDGLKLNNKKPPEPPEGGGGGGFGGFR